MAPNTASPLRRVMNTLGSVKTGVFVLIIIGIVSAAGTVVLQRPITEPEQMEQAYSPGTLKVLDAVGLTAAIVGIASHLGTGPVLAKAIAIVVSFQVTYMLRKNVVFA